MIFSFPVLRTGELVREVLASAPEALREDDRTAEKVLWLVK